MVWRDFGVVFDFVFAKVFFAVTFETCFCHQDVWIASSCN